MSDASTPIVEAEGAVLHVPALRLQADLRRMGLLKVSGLEMLVPSRAGKPGGKVQVLFDAKEGACVLRLPGHGSESIVIDLGALVQQAHEALYQMRAQTSGEV